VREYKAASFQARRDPREIAERFDKAKRDGRGWRFACPFCGGHGWVREYQFEIKLGCWGCGDWKGLRRVVFGDDKPPSRETRPKAAADALNAEAQLTKAIALWRSAMPIKGTIAETYLRRRGLDPTHFDLEALRFIQSLWHWPTRTVWPAMVALIRTHYGHDLGLHETFLALDGVGKAPVEKARLYRRGLSIAGGGVWFGTPGPDSEFVVAEGIESLLSALQLCGERAGCAALSASGIRTLALPLEVRRVRVFADNDELGHGVAAAREAYRRWRAEGRTVAVSMAIDTGCDANYVLLRRQRRA
jgi:putative DNA primase/helicase